MISSDDLGLRLLTIAASLPMNGPEYDTFLHALADYTKALRLELLDRMYQWAEQRRDEEALAQPFGAQETRALHAWNSVIGMIRLQRETL